MNAINLKFVGKNLTFPTEKQLRRIMLAAAEDFHQKTGMAITEIGQRALNDPAFISDVKAGRNLKIRTFEVFMRWLDQHWPAEQCKEKERIA